VRFWDSSAVVPLVVRQARSDAAEAWIREDLDAVTWTLTEVEVRSAIRRLVREGVLEESIAFVAEALAGDLLDRFHLVTDVERAKSIASRLLRLHALRAADALQLAAAVLWADDAPSRCIVHTFDRRLALAAQREGFRVVPAPAAEGQGTGR
jgi:predicted nucleic acid-binding protein